MRSLIDYYNNVFNGDLVGDRCDFDPIPTVIDIVLFEFVFYCNFPFSPVGFIQIRRDFSSTWFRVFLCSHLGHYNNNFLGAVSRLNKRAEYRGVFFSRVRNG